MKKKFGGNSSPTSSNNLHKVSATEYTALTPSSSEKYAVPRGKKVTYGRLVCDIKEHKSETHRTRLTVGGNLLDFPGMLSTPTATVTTAKCLFNSVISTPGAKCLWVPESQGVGNRIDDTNTIFFEKKYAVPKGKKVTYGRLVCDIKEHKSETHQTWLTVSGNLLDFTGLLSTPTLTVTTAKCLFNSVISTPWSKCLVADVNIFLPE